MNKMFQLLFNKSYVINFKWFFCLTIVPGVLSDSINADELVQWGTYFTGTKFWNHRVSHIGSCAKLCVRMTLCASFNFDLSTYVCELNTDTLDNDPEKMLASPTSVYSKIQDWPEKIDPDCYPRPCGVDEVCIPNQLATFLSRDSMCLKRWELVPQKPTSPQQMTLATITIPLATPAMTTQLTTATTQITTTSTSATTVTTPTSSTSATTVTTPTSADCGSLLNPVNGAVSIIGNQAGDTATYKCNYCYALNGEGMRTCQPDGLWDGTEPTCTALPKYDGSCYYFFMENQTWSEAVESCYDLSDDAYLVEFDSSEENAFVVNQLNSLSGASDNSWWTGGTDADTEGSFVWQDFDDPIGQPNEPDTDWFPGQPNDANDEDCLALEPTGYKWADRHCLYKYFYICELET